MDRAEGRARWRGRLFFVFADGVVDGVDGGEDGDDSAEVHGGFL